LHINIDMSHVSQFLLKYHIYVNLFDQVYPMIWCKWIDLGSRVGCSAGNTWME
jgi:hypothetical protein